MARRNNQRNNNRSNVKASRAVTRTPAAPTPVQQPKPNIQIPGQWRYVSNLNAPGTNEYNRWTEKLGSGYDGGGWVGQMPNAPGNPTDDDLRALAKANSMPGGGLGLGSWDAIRSKAAEWDQLQASKAATTSESTATPQKKSYKDVNTIRGGLKIGSNNILGAGEARKISRATGRPQDKVIAKALESGFGIGGNLVNQSNKAFRPSMNPLAIDPLSAMRGIETGGKGQIYSGSYKLDGETMPIVQTRRGGANKLSIGGGGMGGNRDRKNKRKRGKGGADTAADMGTDMGTTAQQQPMSDYMPPMMDEPLPEPDININIPGVGEDVFNQATGFRTKKSRRKMQGRLAQGLGSQRVSPLGPWRFGT